MFGFVCVFFFFVSYFVITHFLIVDNVIYLLSFVCSILSLMSVCNYLLIICSKNWFSLMVLTKKILFGNINKFNEILFVVCHDYVYKLIIY